MNDDGIVKAPPAAAQHRFATPTGQHSCAVLAREGIILAKDTPLR
jgi:hypothetical protein